MFTSTLLLTTVEQFLQFYTLGKAHFVFRKPGSFSGLLTYESKGKTQLKQVVAFFNFMKDTKSDQTFIHVLTASPCNSKL